MGSFTLLDDQQVDASLVAVDDQGNPAALPAGATVVWSSSDSTIATVAQNANNPLAATIATTGKLGDVQVTATLTPAPGSGGSPLTGLLAVSVVASAAVSVNVQPGTPVARVPAGGDATAGGVSAAGA